MHALVLLLAAAVSQGVVGDLACVSGQVRSVEGEALAAARVTLLAWRAPEQSRKLRADATGSFRADSLEPGRYWLVAEKLGYEPELVELVLGPGDEHGMEVTLTRLSELAATPHGREELPWLLRGVSDDPLRSPGVLAGPPSADSAPGNRPVQGRFAWNALAGSLEGGDLPAALGSRAQVEMGGSVLGSAHWFVDGRLDELDYQGQPAQDSADAGTLYYGVDYEDPGSRIAFRGSVVQARRQVGGDTAFGERRAAYAVDYRTPASEDAQGLSVTYRAAVADLAMGPSEYEVEDRHAIWEGSGWVSRRIAQRHRVLGSLRVRTQRYTQPNESLLADASPRVGLLRDGRLLETRPWEAYLSSSHEWWLLPYLTLVPGVDATFASGDPGKPLLRPRLGGVVSLGAGARILADAGWVVQDYGSASAPGAAGPDRTSRSYRVTLEKDLGGRGKVRLSALHNGYLDGWQGEAEPMQSDSFLLFASGPVEARELRLRLDLTSERGITGFAVLSVGVADGLLGLVPLAYGRPGGEIRYLGETEVHHASAAIGTIWRSSGTGLLVRYQWLDGVGPEPLDVGRIDVELGQRIPWATIVGSELELLLAVRGLSGLVPSETSQLLAFDPSPLVSAGLGLSF